MVVYNNELINLRNDSTASPSTMNLTCIVDMSNYTLSVSVLRFTFHLDDFDSISNFNLVHNVLLIKLYPLYGFCLDLFIKIWYNYRVNYAIRR